MQYCSVVPHEIINAGDFYNHPISHLTSELYEIHNREKFEIHVSSSFILPARRRIHHRPRGFAPISWSKGKYQMAIFSPILVQSLQRLLFESL